MYVIKPTDKMQRFVWMLMLAATVATAGESPGPASLRLSLSEEDKAQILDRHNFLRNKVAGGQELRGSPGPQPVATDMALLTWDDELAATAQRWADEMTFDYDESRHPEGEWIGQNIHLSCVHSGPIKTPANYDWKDEIGEWYDEVENMQAPRSGRPTPGFGTTHYTQMVWAKTKKVGCGVHTSTGEELRGWWMPPPYFCQMLVCNYKPGGNIGHADVYSATKKRCANTDTKYPLLCL